MRAGLLLGMVAALSACAPLDGEDTQKRPANEIQVPSNTTPGIHIGGHVNVGVVRTF